MSGSFSKANKPQRTYNDVAMNGASEVSVDLYFYPKYFDGFMNLIIEGETTTSGMTSVDVAIRPLMRPAIDDKSEVTAIQEVVGSDLVVATGIDLTTSINAFDLTKIVANSADARDFISGDGLRVKLTGDSGDVGTARVAVRGR